MSNYCVSPFLEKPVSVITVNQEGVKSSEVVKTIISNNDYVTSSKLCSMLDDAIQERLIMITKEIAKKISFAMVEENIKEICKDIIDSTDKKLQRLETDLSIQIEQQERKYTDMVSKQNDNIDKQTEYIETLIRKLIQNEYKDLIIQNKQTNDIQENPVVKTNELNFDEPVIEMLKNVVETNETIPNETNETNETIPNELAEKTINNSIIETINIEKNNDIEQNIKENDDTNDDTNDKIEDEPVIVTKRQHKNQKDTSKKSSTTSTRGKKKNK